MASNRALAPPPSPRPSSQQCKMAAPVSPSPSMQQELSSQHITSHLPGHLPAAGSPHSPALPAEEGRGLPPRQRARTASLQDLLGLLLCSCSLRTNRDKMAERRGRSRQPAHLTRKYRPSRSPTRRESAFCGRVGGGVTFLKYCF